MAARKWVNGRWVYRDSADTPLAVIPPAAVTAADVSPVIDGWSARRVIDWVGQDADRARHALDVEHTYTDTRATVVRHCARVLA